MKNKTNNWRIVLLALLVSMLSGCGKMLDDPTVDKNTGEDINFLLVDFNFFTTRMDFKFIDSETNTPITKPAKMWFTGKNANEIVNFSGEKNAQYNTSQGQMVLTVDPNLDISASSPLEYAVNVEIEGYLPFSQGLQINSEGKKTFELLLTKESAGKEITLTGQEEGDSYVFSFVSETTKSAKTVEEAPFSVEYSILTSDLINMKDMYGQTFPNIDSASITIDKYSDFQLIVESLNKDGVVSEVGLKKLELGTLIKIMINGNRIVNLHGGTVNLAASYNNIPTPDIFGFGEFDVDEWNFLGNLDTLKAIGDTYDLISASTEQISALGCNITFNSNAISSFSIDADIINSQGDTIKSVNFKGNFPETFILENVPAQSATLEFRNNNPAFQALSPLAIADLSSGSSYVQVVPTSGYKEYQIVLKATCKDNSSVAVAPTYSGEYRIIDSLIWQGVDMIGGKADLLAKPNEDYEFQLLWNSEYEGTNFSTKFDSDGTYLGTTSSTVKSENIIDSPARVPARVRIIIKHEFDQSICDDMNW